MLKIRTVFTDRPYGAVDTASVWLQQVLLKLFHMKGNLVPLLFCIEVIESGVQEQWEEGKKKRESRKLREVGVAEIKSLVHK